jgi:hypothetical protein
MADPLPARVEMKMIGMIGIVFWAQRHVKNLTCPLANISEELTLWPRTEVVFEHIDRASIDKREPRNVSGSPERMFTQGTAAADPPT